MPDNRRFKGRSDILENILGGIVAAYGDNVSVNPEYEALDEQVGPISPEQEKIKPFKADNIWAKGTAGRMNSQYLGEKVAKESNIRSKPRELSIENEAKLDLARRMGVITAEQQKILNELDRQLAGQKEEKTTEETIKRGDAGVVQSKGLLSSRAKQYDTATGDLGVEAAKTDFEKQRDTNREVSAKAKTGKEVADTTREADIATAGENAITGFRAAKADSRLLNKKIGNTEFDLDNYQENKEMENVLKRFQTVAPGTTLLDQVTGKPVYTAPAQDIFSDLPPEARAKFGLGSPGIQPQTVQTNQEVITLPSGKKVMRPGKPQASTGVAPKPTTEKSTAVVEEPGPIASAAQATGSNLANAAKVLAKIPKHILLDLVSPYYQPAQGKR